jgi:hypothetical protein
VRCSSGEPQKKSGYDQCPRTVPERFKALDSADFCGIFSHFSSGTPVAEGRPEAEKK